MTEQTVVVATQSKHKLSEIQSFFSNQSELLNRYKFIALSEVTNEQAIENGKTFVENALIKARHASKIANQPALADDSGLCVDVLNGNPGIYSSRFVAVNSKNSSNNKQNNYYLLEQLKQFPNSNQRKAHFVTVLVWLNSVNDPDPIIVQSHLYGTILKKERGSFGFGYDPLFYLPKIKKTLAEIPLNEKNQISHRAKALIQLKNQLLRSFNLQA